MNKNSLFAKIMAGTLAALVVLGIVAVAVIAIIQ